MAGDSGLLHTDIRDLGVLGTEKRTATCKGPCYCLCSSLCACMQPVQASRGDSVISCACSRTLEPHLFIFTVESVRAGQEVLLDYGEVKPALFSLNVHLSLCSSLRQPLLLRSLPYCRQGLGFQ